jgi:hypothetical protein
MIIAIPVMLRKGEKMKARKMKDETKKKWNMVFVFVIEILTWIVSRGKK